MAQSKHGLKHKTKKKKANIKKAKQREMDNINQAKMDEQPVGFEFQKDAKTVTISLNAWKSLVQCAKVLEPLAMMISVMEQIGREQIESGELLPVFIDDTEVIPGTQPDQYGRVQRKIKDSFWTKSAKKKGIIESISGLGEASIVMADGVTVYDKNTTTTTADKLTAEQPPLTATE
jgi:hypothetical protein